MKPKAKALGYLRSKGKQQQQIPFGNDRQRSNCNSRGDDVRLGPGRGDVSMEMEMSVEMNETVERLATAAGLLEAAVSRLSGIQVQAAEAVTHELEEKLVAAEARIAELMARGGSASFGYGRRTLQAKAAAPVEGLEGGIDAALTSLSLEQRIAVKSQLMRSGCWGKHTRGLKPLVLSGLLRPKAKALGYLRSKGKGGRLKPWATSEEGGRAGVVRFAHYGGVGRARATADSRRE